MGDMGQSRTEIDAHVPWTRPEQSRLSGPPQRKELPDLAQASVAICTLLNDIAGVNLRPFEEAAVSDLMHHLQPQVMSWLSRALEIAHKLSRSSASLPPLSAPTTARDSDYPEALPSSDLADTAHIAALELSSHASRVARLSAATDPLDFLTTCDGARDRLRTCLCAMEETLARRLERPPTLPVHDTLPVALKIRRAYAWLRSSVLGRAPRSPADLLASFRQIGTKIAMLVGAEVYPHLRFRDRAQLLAIQQRILAWLASAVPRDEVGGQRLWRDVEGFLRMLQLISNRQELVAHDTTVLTGLARDLRSSVPPRFEDSLLRRLKTLQGLDDELDALLAKAPAVPHSVWKQAIERLHAERVQTQTSAWGA